MIVPRVSRGAGLFGLASAAKFQTGSGTSALPCAARSRPCSVLRVRPLGCSRVRVHPILGGYPARVRVRLLPHLTVVCWPVCSTNRGWRGGLRSPKGGRWELSPRMVRRLLFPPGMRSL